MRWMTMGVFVVALGLAACGKKGAEGGGGGAASGGGGGGGGEAPAAALPADAVGKANGAVPKELADKLKFAERKVDDKVKILAVAPEGWKESEVIPGSFAPPDDKNLGFRTKFSLGHNCDGSCEAKDWAATADKVEFAQFKGGAQFKVVRDEPGTGKRLLVATGDDGSAYVRAAFWKDGESRYVACSATLDKEAAPAVEAFAAACASTTPVW